MSSASLGVGVLLVFGCSSATTPGGTAGPGGTGPGGSGNAAVASDAPKLFDSAVVHAIAVEFDQAEFETMIKTFVDTGDKGWIKATVTIDGTTFREVGMRLKGNSSLGGLGGQAIPGVIRNTMGASGSVPPGGPPSGAPPVGLPPGMPGANASKDKPELLPWVIRFDKFVEDQRYQGYSQIAVRSSMTKVPLNEAVAVELLGAAGLATQKAFPTRFEVKGHDAVLRLVLEVPDDKWVDDTYDGDRLLYKADADGDYLYRGDDPEAYKEAWEQDAGKKDMAPLIAFLKFLNEADDATFAADLPKHLDVDAFATYLAMQDLIANWDDINGPGNNAYFSFDPATGKLTIVPWDHNFAFFHFGRMMAGAMPGGTLPPDAPPMAGAPGGPPLGPTGGIPLPGTTDGGAKLVNRFIAVPAFQEKYDTARARLEAELYTSGRAGEILDRWVKTLEAGATDLVDAAVISSEAEAIRAYFAKK